MPSALLRAVGRTTSSKKKGNCTGQGQARACNAPGSPDRKLLASERISRRDLDLSEFKSIKTQAPKRNTEVVWFNEYSKKNELEQGFFELVCYMITSARNLIPENKLYGPFRLIDAASRLIDIIQKLDLRSQ